MGSASFTKRTYHYACDDITMIRIGYPAWYSNLNSGEVATGAATIAASIEFPFTVSTSGTTCQVATWDGSATGTAVSGVVTWSDPMQVAIPRGAKFGSRFWINSTTSNPYNDAATYIGAWRDLAGGDILDFTGTNLVAGGTMSNDGGQEDFTPIIIGYTRRPSVAIIGDSRQSGWGDTVDTNVGDAGDVARTYGKNLIAYLNLAIGGDTAVSFVTGSNSVQRRLLAQYCTHVTTDMGVNDLDGGASASTTQANIITMLGLSGMVGKPCIYDLIYGESTSTDSWATTGNQTTVAWNTGINTIDAWLQAGTPPHVTGLSDSRAIVMNPPTTNGIWRAPGYTADGAHPTQAGYQDIMNGGGVNPAFITRRV